MPFSEDLWPLHLLRRTWNCLLTDTGFHKRATERLYELTLTLLASTSALVVVVFLQGIYFSLMVEPVSWWLQLIDYLLFYGGLAVEFWLLWVLLTRYLLVIRSEFICLIAGMATFVTLAIIIVNSSELTRLSQYVMAGIWSAVCLRPAVLGTSNFRP